MQNPSRHDVLGREAAGKVPSPAEDRRGHPRYLLRLRITMHGENNFYAGLSENISEAGVFIATAHTLPIGTPVVLSFTLPNAEDPIAVVGTVQWIRDQDATVPPGNNFGAHFNDLKPGMGVKFEELSEESLRLIRSFMQHREPDFFA